MCHEGNCVTGFSCTCCAAHAVNISLAVRRQVEIEDEIHRGYIETAGRDVSGDEDVTASSSEL